MKKQATVTATKITTPIAIATRRPETVFSDGCTLFPAG